MTNEHLLRIESLAIRSIDRPGFPSWAARLWLSDLPVTMDHAMRVFHRTRKALIYQHGLGLSLGRVGSGKRTK